MAQIPASIRLVGFSHFSTGSPRLDVSLSTLRLQLVYLDRCLGSEIWSPNKTTSVLKYGHRVFREGAKTIQEKTINAFLKSYIPTTTEGKILFSLVIVVA